MFKRFILMLIIAFAWQAGWAAVTPYCLHEQGNGSYHFGHHEHEHQPDEGKSKAEKVSSANKAAAHSDCATCNHHGSLGLGVPQRPSAVADGCLSHCDLTEIIPSSAHRSLLERPKWHADSQFGADHPTFYPALAAKT